MNYYLTQSGYSSASHLLILRLNYRGATSHVISRHRIPFLTITKECPSPILITTTCKICKQTWSNRGVVGQTEYQVSAALSSVYQGIMGISECATQHNCCRASGLVNAAIWLAVGGGAVVTPRDLGRASRLAHSPDEANDGKIKCSSIIAARAVLSCERYWFLWNC